MKLSVHRQVLNGQLAPTQGCESEEKEGKHRGLLSFKFGEIKLQLGFGLSYGKTRKYSVL